MEFNEDIQGLRALIEEQQRAIDEQARQITDLRARLDGNGGAGDASSAHQRDGSDANAIEGGELQAGLSVVDDDHDGRTDRRGLLRQAGAAVAGVAAGAVVMGQVSPAAAAQGTFDGNPAVLGTANPNTGLGVRGDTITGTGVQGRSQAAAGPAIGVEGLVAGTNSTGVRGIATAASSATIGVLGQVSSTSGVAVKAVNQSSTGSTVGVRAEVESPSGVGVVANNASPTGDAIAIAGVNGSPTGTAIVANALAASGSTVGVAGNASSVSGTGVNGAGGGIGVRGATTNGFGVAASSSRSQVILQGSPAPPLTAGLLRGPGELVFDTNGVLWLCVAAGNPGTWRRLGGAGTAGALTLLPTPVRVYDSRPGNNPATPPKSPITGNTTRVLNTKNNSSGVPAGASGVLVTLTVVNGSANGGFLALFAAGSPTPSTSSINWSGAGQVVATTTVSAVSANAEVAVFCPPNSSTDLILDVIGYYQ